MKTTTPYVPSILMAVVFYFLFRNESVGINALLFFLLSSASLAILNAGTFRITTVKVTFIITLLLGALLIVFNTDISIISFWILFAVMTGFVHQFQLRSAGTALLTALTGFLTSPVTWWNGIKLMGRSSRRISTFLKYLQLSFIPGMVLLFFFAIYSFSDPQFNQVSNQLLSHLFDLVEKFFTYISAETIVFFFFSMLMAAAILFNRNIQLMVNYEIRQNNFLFRKRKKETRTEGIEWWQLFFKKSMISLRYEYRRGIILLMLVNLLLLFVNVVDVKMVWFENVSVASPSARSQAVHESTYMLLFSIAIAMLLLIFFFRGNINFLKSNKQLLRLSYIWIIQNMVLACTVGVRNYYYIRDYGLAYKRIGIIFFLLLTIFSLVMLYFKIRDKRSFFYFYRMESWAICGLLLLMSCFNWDPMIASYNLSHFDKQKVDQQFLMTLSHRALPTIIAHEESFPPESISPMEELSSFQKWIKFKSQSFIESYEATSWPSWNYADDRIYRFLKHKQL